MEVRREREITRREDTKKTGKGRERELDIMHFLFFSNKITSNFNVNTKRQSLLNSCMPPKFEQEELGNWKSGHHNDVEIACGQRTVQRSTKPYLLQTHQERPKLENQKRENPLQDPP